MSSPVELGKTGVSVLRVDEVAPTTRLTEKPSDDSLASLPLPASAEKNKVVTVTRPSDASTPPSMHRGNPFDTDIEAMITTATDPGYRRSRMDSRTGGNDCQVWPGKDHWRRKAKAAKMSRRTNCNCLSHLSKRNRIIVKVLIAMFIIGIAIGVGFGVSKPLGAGIWHNSRS